MRLKPLDVPLDIQTHLPLDGDDFGFRESEVAKICQAVFREAVHDLSDRRVSMRERARVWRWIAARQHRSGVSFRDCATLFDRDRDDDEVEAYGAKLLAAAAEAVRDGSSRRVLAMVWRWVTDERTHPFSFKSCCALRGMDSDQARDSLRRIMARGKAV